MLKLKLENRIQSKWQYSYLTGRRKSEDPNRPASGPSMTLAITGVPHVVYFLPRDGFDAQQVHAEVDELFEVIMAYL